MTHSTSREITTKIFTNTKKKKKLFVNNKGEGIILYNQPTQLMNNIVTLLIIQPVINSNND